MHDLLYHHYVSNFLYDFFFKGNYVFERDELLDLQKEEYDVILALSITKWLHLNFGDGGLKRSFKRMHRQLRPGGKLILEPQSYASYNKKKNLNVSLLVLLYFLNEYISFFSHGLSCKTRLENRFVVIYKVNLVYLKASLLILTQTDIFSETS